MRGLMSFAATVVVVAAPFAVGAQQPASLAEALASAHAQLTGLTVPLASAFVRGDREITAGTTVKGPIAASGTVRVVGTVEGDVFTHGGDIVVPAGGHITGSAVALNGRVQIDGGVVDGDLRAIGGALTPVVATGAVKSTSENLKLTAGWAVVGLLVGIGVLVFGGRTLDTVADVVDRHFGRSFVIGLAATLGVVPGLALLVVALVLTILGVLLVPFAIVAYALAVIGVIALGFVAAARAAGHAFAGRGGGSERGASLRALVLGLAFFICLWMLAALLTPMPAIASATRVLAFAITWAAATVGLGATILSRAGTRPVPHVARGFARTEAGARRARDEAAAAPASAPPPEWQTPTPVSGVVAAGRRTSSSSHKAT